MNVDISGSQIVLLLFNGVLLLLAFFVRMWINRLQADLDSTKKNYQELLQEFRAYQLQSIRDFATKDDVSSGRQELMATMREVHHKVDRIFDKLDMKADKP